MTRALLLPILLSAFASFAQAQGLTIDPNGAHAAFSERTGWGEIPSFVNEEFIQKVKDGHRSSDLTAVERLLEALQTTYFGAEIGGISDPEGGFWTTYLSIDGEIVLLRLFLSTVGASDQASRQFFELLSEVMGDELELSPAEMVRKIWDSYLDPSKRQFEHGWVNISSIENRVIAWGVPPDFIVIVISCRTDCEFLPASGWFPRQIWP